MAASAMTLNVSVTDLLPLERLLDAVTAMLEDLRVKGLVSFADDSVIELQAAAHEIANIISKDTDGD